MFRTRRSLSVRKLWRQRCTTPSRGQGERAAPSPEEHQNALRAAAHQLFMKLKDEQLWRLAEAVESRGRWECGCICLPWDARSGKSAALLPQVLLCKLYRWPDLRSSAELKRLLHCEEHCRSDGGSALCCNPYHVSRLAAPEPVVSLPYKAGEPARPVLSFSPSIIHQETSCCNVRGIHDTTLSRGSHRDGHWCKLAYWEHRTRVGRLYNVTDPSIHIFHHLPKGSGFCLGFLGCEARSGVVRRTRKKIGQGLLLSRERDDVWVYNRSEHPIFINSPTLSARGQAVHKLLPGYSIKVFDSVQAANLSGSSALGDGPCDTHSVRISFAKGWGACYSRQFITSCPCWLEILLSTPK